MWSLHRAEHRFTPCRTHLLKLGVLVLHLLAPRTQLADTGRKAAALLDVLLLAVQPEAVAGLEGGIARRARRRAQVVLVQSHRQRRVGRQDQLRVPLAPVPVVSVVRVARCARRIRQARTAAGLGQRRATAVRRNGAEGSCERGESGYETADSLDASNVNGGGSRSGVDHGDCCCGGRRTRSNKSRPEHGGQSHDRAGDAG